MSNQARRFQHSGIVDVSSCQSGLSNREKKELEKLLKKKSSANLNEHEKNRLTKLESISNNTQSENYSPKDPNQKYNLNWFSPKGKQQLISSEIDKSEAVVVQAPSGCGKSTVAVWKALNMLGKQYKHIVFIKNPTESGDDKIGFLTGDKESKLEAHFESMRDVFLDFMSKGQLESDEKNGNIKFMIPNFMLGSTISNSCVIVDEAQVLSPKTLKLIMERVDDSCKLVILGDYKQRYSVDKRDDGLSDFVKRICDVDEYGNLYSIEPLFSYVELTTSENQRGKISKRVTELYSD